MLQQFALNCPYLHSFNAGGGVEWEGGWGVFKNSNLIYRHFQKKLQQIGKKFRKLNSVSTAGWIRVPVLQRVWKEIRIQPSRWISNRIHARMTKTKTKKKFHVLRRWMFSLEG
jgi:hypothetical protein